MKPKNEKEINNAFFQFLLLFLVTVTIVVVAIFFDYGFPWVHYNKLKTQAIETRGLLQNKNEKFETVNNIINQIQGYNAAAGKTIIETNVKKGLDKLSSYNTNGNSKIDSLIVVCLSTMFDDKKQLGINLDELKKKEADLQMCASERDSYKKDAEDYKDKYDTYIATHR